MTDMQTGPQRTLAPPVPSIHVRALITWLAIFPMVAVGLALLGPVSTEWPSILRALVLTVILVPIAVYLIVPALMRAYVAIVRRGDRLARARQGAAS